MASERGRKGSGLRRLPASLLLGAAVFAACYPLIVLAAGSLMDAAELATVLGGAAGSGNASGFACVPLFLGHPALSSYAGVLLDEPAFHVLFRNSATVTACVLAGQMLAATPAAWALARFRFPGRNALFFVYVLLMALPFQAVMLPNYLVASALGLDGSLLAVILPGAFAALPVFVMRHFFAGIPDHVVEAARLDGAGEARVFLRIGVPLGAPGLMAALVLGFFEYWNLVEQPLAFLHDPALWPLSLFQPAATAENMGLLFASAAIAAVPAVLVFLMGKDHLAAGIAATTRKDA